MGDFEDLLLEADRIILLELKHMNHKLERLMTIQDDLTAAVTAMGNAVTTLTSNIAANDAAVQVELKALSDALAGGNTDAISTAISNISTLSASVSAASAAIANETAALMGSLPPPATTAPAPTPTPSV